GPLWSLPLQQFVYRQLMYLVVIQSVFTAVSGSRLRWQRMERYGSLQAPGDAKAGKPPVAHDAFQQPVPYDGHPQSPPHNGFRQPAPHETPQLY
ncbi:bi-functional transferase/deacetylase, partial [Streptomyces sp. NPDC047009]